MKSHLAALALALLTLTFGVSTGQSKINYTSSNCCGFPAIFNFGDSNSDTGEASAAFSRVDYPLWFSYIDKPSGRFSDGRLIIDFIAAKLGFPYLSPYLDSLKSNFKRGVNFAAYSATIQHADGSIYGNGFSPFSLDVQLSQFEQFKNRTFELYKQAKWSWFFLAYYLPKPEDFSKSLYRLDIGQNDLSYGFKTMTLAEVMETLPDITTKFSTAVEKLYELGARTFWIQNTGPIGCLPYYVINFPQKPEDRDQNGCNIPHNEVAQEFNRQLKDKVCHLRKRFSDSAFTFTDVYTAKYSLISKAKEYGFGDPLGYCCGHLGDKPVDCDENVRDTSFLCSKPDEFISWDGIHYTQSANEKIAKMILDATLSDLPIPLSDQISHYIVTEKQKVPLEENGKDEGCGIEQLKPQEFVRYQ